MKSPLWSESLYREQGLQFCTSYLWLSLSPVLSLFIKDLRLFINGTVHLVFIISNISIALNYTVIHSLWMITTFSYLLTTWEVQFVYFRDYNEITIKLSWRSVDNLELSECSFNFVRLKLHEWLMLCHVVYSKSLRFLINVYNYILYYLLAGTDSYFWNTILFTPCMVPIFAIYSEWYAMRMAKN